MYHMTRIDNYSDKNNETKPDKNEKTCCEKLSQSKKILLIVLIVFLGLALMAVAVTLAIVLTKDDDKNNTGKTSSDIY